MKRLLKFVVVVCLMVGLSGGLYSNGLNLNSNGSKALAMGGAFVGLADDFSAGFWNPAGLTQLKQPILGGFFSDIIPKGTYQLDLYGIDAETESKHYLSGALGYYRPMNDRLVLGVYVYVPSGTGANYNGADLVALSGGMAYDWHSYFNIITIAPTIAYKISDNVSVGATLNISRGMLELDRPGLGQYSEDINGFGVSATFGLMFKPTEKLSIGFTYRTPLKATFDGEASMSGAATVGLTVEEKVERETTMPMWIAGGIAYKPNNRLTLTFDLQWTQWSKIVNIPANFTDNALWTAYFSDAVQLDMDWDDALMVRAGLEYKVNEAFALRCGYYYDPSPGPKHTQNILLPEFTYNWVTFGFGYENDRFAVDFGFEYGMGKDVEVGLTEGDMPGIHGLNIFVPTFSVTIKL